VVGGLELLEESLELLAGVDDCNVMLLDGARVAGAAAIAVVMAAPAAMVFGCQTWISNLDS